MFYSVFRVIGMFTSVQDRVETTHALKFPPCSEDFSSSCFLIFFAHLACSVPKFLLDCNINFRPSDRSEKEDLYLYTVINMVVPACFGDFPRGAIENLSIRRTTLNDHSSCWGPTHALDTCANASESGALSRYVVPLAPSHSEFD